MSSPAEPESQNWLELPVEVTSLIFSKLRVVDILTSVQYVCSSWFWICKDPSMWRTIDMYDLGDSWGIEHNLEKMCRHAVDRSNGQLIYINIEYFGTDHLLKYIADRSNRLRHLRLVCCYSISDEAMSEAAAKLTLLEELELSNWSFSPQALEAFGSCCPLLKSLKLNLEPYRWPHIENDEDALAIAKLMPGLRHLQLFGNKLTSVGLEAILSGCPHLESLDLRQCFNVNLRGNLEKRCAERIKYLRRPNDSTDDYEFDTGVGVLNAGESSEEDRPYGMSDIELETDDEGDYYEFSSDSYNHDNAYDYDYDSDYVMFFD